MVFVAQIYKILALVFSFLINSLVVFIIRLQLIILRSLNGLYNSKKTQACTSQIWIAALFNILFGIEDFPKECQQNSVRKAAGDFSKIKKIM